MSVPLPGAVVRLRVLVAAFSILAVMFAGATFLAGWYKRQRLVRARQAFEIGASLEAQGREKQAIRLYGDALAVAPRPEYRLAMARALMKLDRAVEASLYLHEVLQTEPAEAYPNLLLARIAVRRNENEQAIRYYQRAIYGRWPTDPERHSADARWELVALLVGMNQRAAATAELLKLAEQALDSGVRVKAAGMLVGLRSPNQAAKIYEEVLSAEPRDEAALAGLGRAHMDLGDYRQARTVFRRALRQDPADSEIRQSLEQVEAILALDPTERGLTVSQRYSRGRRILQRALDYVLQCGRPGAFDAATQESIDEANALLRRRVRASTAAEEAALVAAEQLWDRRAQACGPDVPRDEVLERVLARIEK